MHTINETSINCVCNTNLTKWLEPMNTVINQEGWVDYGKNCIQLICTKTHDTKSIDGTVMYPLILF